MEGEDEFQFAEFNLEDVVLGCGEFESPVDGMDILAYVSILAGEPFNYTRRCVGFTVTHYASAFNDNLTDETRQRLKEYARDMIGTVVSDEPHLVRPLYDVLLDTSVRWLRALYEIEQREWVDKPWNWWTRIALSQEPRDWSLFWMDYHAEGAPDPEERTPLNLATCWHWRALADYVDRLYEEGSSQIPYDVENSVVGVLLYLAYLDKSWWDQGFVLFGRLIKMARERHRS